MVPKDGQHVRRMVSIVVSADNPTYVALYKDGSVIATDFTAPYEFSWQTSAEAEGPHTLMAKAVGAPWGEATTPRLTVTVDNTPPTVELTVPVEHATIVGISTLQAQAADVLGLQAVQFFLDGAELATAFKPPYAVEWDAREIPNGRHSLQARALDLAGNDATSRAVTVWIANPNDPPVLDPPAPSTALENRPWTLQLKATEPNAPRDPITYAVKSLPSWVTLNPSTGLLSGTPGFEVASREQPMRSYPGITVKACDPEPLCQEQPLVLSVMNANRSPVLEPIGPQSIEEGELLVITLQASDPDGDAVTCRMKQVPPWMRFDAERCLARGVPSDEPVPLTEPTTIYPEVVAEACDPEGACASETFTVTVTGVGNQPPVLTMDASARVDEGKHLAVEVQAEDPEHESVMLTAEPLPEGATFTDHIDDTGVLSWTPRADQQGAYDVAVTADDKVQKTTQMIRLIVNEASLSIAGIVKDDLGAPVEGALMEVGTAKAILRMVSTDAKGYYLASGLPPGLYAVSPSYKLKEIFSGVARTQLSVIFSPEKTRVTITDTDKTGIDFTAIFPPGAR